MFAAVQREKLGELMHTRRTSTGHAMAGPRKNATVEKYFIWLAMLLRCDTWRG